MRKKFLSIIFTFLLIFFAGGERAPRKFVTICLGPPEPHAAFEQGFILINLLFLVR